MNVESLIILIIFVLLSSLGNGKKRRNGRRPQTRTANPIQQMVNEVLQTADSANVRRATRPQTARRSHRNEAEQECGYCTGDIVAESVLTHHEAAPPPQTTDTPYVDVSALQKQWGLSDLQTALVWREILDKPLALRRRSIR